MFIKGGNKMKYKCAFKDESGKTIPNRKNRKSEKRVAFLHNKTAASKVRKFKKWIRGMVNGTYDLKAVTGCTCPSYTEDVEKLAGRNHPYAHTTFHRKNYVPEVVTNDTTTDQVQA